VVAGKRAEVVLRTRWFQSSRRLLFLQGGKLGVVLRCDLGRGEDLPVPVDGDVFSRINESGRLSRLDPRLVILLGRRQPNYILVEFVLRKYRRTGGSLGDPTAAVRAERKGMVFGRSDLKLTLA
jgi:hypothetical protein